MAKDKLTDYDSTASNNLDVGGISVAEGMLPSGVNNAIRELMSHQADAFGAGTPLYVDQTNNRLGINQAAPAHPIHVGTDDLILDASGNFLVATTSTGPAVSNTETGVALGAAGYVAASRSNDASGFFNRLSTDGNIVNFNKDGTTVGSIGSVVGPRLYIASGDTGLRMDGGSDTVLPSDGSGNARDNAVDFGDTGTRFKDLYLSGGVYLGGVAAANKLDDYEEGTFTPTYTTSDNNLGSVTYNFAEGKYTKIGNVVYCWVTLRSTAITIGGATGFAAIGGLPFASNKSTSTPQIGRYDNWNTLPSGFRVDVGTTILRCVTADSTAFLTAAQAFNTGGSANFIDYTFFYYTDY